MKVSIPYGRKHLEAELEDKNLLGVYTSSVPAPASDPIAEVERALDTPIGSLKLEELIEKLGEDIVKREHIVCHDSTDDNMMADIGVLPSGGRLLVNRLAVEADLLVSEGFIEPHFFAGFSGGRKSVLPGIASKETVLANHCSEFIADPKSRTGITASSPKVLLDEILKVPRDSTIADQWQVQILARILCRCSVIMVTEDCDHDMLRAMGLEAVASLDDAIALARELVGEDAGIAVIPDGVSMVTEVAAK